MKRTTSRGDGICEECSTHERNENWKILISIYREIIVTCIAKCYEVGLNSCGSVQRGKWKGWNCY